MARITPRILKGFRDYLPETMRPKQKMLDRVAIVFESFGFAPLATPAIEYAEILLGKYGDEGDKLLYRFRDNGDRDVALRYDLTIPLARVVAMNKNQPTPFKRYQIAPVWRAEKPGRGRYREFMQCDIDIVGTDSLMADAECITVGGAVLDALGVGDFEIRISNRKLLEGLFDKLALERGDAGLGVMRTIDKLPKIGEAAVRQLLATDNGLAPANIDSVFEFLGLAPADLETYFDGIESGLQGARELHTVLELARAQSMGDRVVVDLSIARGLDYYTGTIYETFLTRLEGIGSVMSGGRYDGLLGVFQKESLPAVGISLGVDRLFAALTELALVDSRAWPTAVLVALFDASDPTYAYRIARTLRDAGVPTEIFMGTGRMRKQFQYADRKRIPYVVVGGPDEAAASEVTLKTLATGEQIRIPLADLGDHVTT